jgi:hypothetical protein
MKKFSMQFLINWLSWLCIWLLLVACTIACAQEREEDNAAARTESKDAAKRAKKAERKTRQEKKDDKSAATKLPPPPDTPPELEFFDGAIFSRKVNLGFKNVLCFASERRPLAMLWKEAGQEGGGILPIKLLPRELQLIFGRQVDPTQISVLSANGQMLSRGTAMQVTFDLERRPIYLLVEITPSRPRAAGKN